MNQHPHATDADTHNALPPTTQEIAQAIASLEARQSSHRSQAVQTNTVREVIDHLGLDISAEDVLAEVQAQRARRKPLGSLPSAVRKRVLGVAAVGGLLICWGAWLSQEGSPQADTTPAPAVMAPAIYTPPPQHLKVTPDTLVKDTAGHTPTLKTLAEVPDNYPVQCGFLPTGQTKTSGSLWTLVKHGGKVYLRCWVVSMSAGALQQQSTQPKGVMLFLRRGSSNGGLPTTVPLTLPTDAVSVQPDDIWTEGYFLTSHALRLDSHAHEPWNP